MDKHLKKGLKLMHKITRRQFLKNSVVVAGSGLALAGIAGCSSSSSTTNTTNTSSSSDTIELEYWYSWTDKIKQNNEDRVQEFNDTIGSEKGIHVTADYQGSYDDLDSKLKSAFAASEEPDVCVMVINNTAAFADEEMIQPLTGLISDDDIDDFWPGLMENCYVDNVLYGVPYLRSTPILYYNKTLFDKAGIDSSAAPSTWDDVVSASKKLQEIGVAGYGFYSYVWVLEALAYCNSGTIFGDDLSGTTAAFNQSEAVEMVKWLKSGVTSNNFQFLGGSNASSTLDSNVTNQQTAMWCTSTANLTNYLDLASQNGYEIGCGFIPKNTQNKVPTGGCNLVMTSRLDGDRKDAAAEFINFMTSKDSAIKNHLQTGYLLTRQSDADAQDITDAYATTPEYQVALDQLQYAIGDYMNEGYTEASKVYTDAVENIMTSDDDPQQILDDAASQCSSILSE